MKKIIYLLALTLSIVVLHSCQKPTDVDNQQNATKSSIVKSMNDLVVDPNFDWKTTKTLDVSVNLPDASKQQKLYILSQDGKRTYFVGYSADKSIHLRTRITIPAYENMLQLKIGDSGSGNAVLVGVDNQSLSYTFHSTKSSNDVCGACDGQISYLKLKYTGTETDPIIKVTQKKGGDKNFVIFEDPVPQNGTFSFIGANTNNKMGAKIKVYINGTEDVEIHTSCSQTILAGMQFGNFLIVEGESANGGPICSVSNTPPSAAFTASATCLPTNTDFTFDASSVSDNEDASANLEVRWDFDNDGTWDTNFGTSKTVTHQYVATGTYTVKMEVRDSGGLTDDVTMDITVDNNGCGANQPPVPAFTFTPSGCITTSTVVNFDASTVSDPEDATASLQVRWDFDGDGTWDTQWSTQKTASHTYGSQGTFNVKMEVKDTDGATADVTHTLTVDNSCGNTPPVASFSWDPSCITTSTTVHFDASSVSDNEDATADLKVKWDFDGDGTWDTPWSTQKTAIHQYTTENTYHVRLKVKDTQGLTDVVTHPLTVDNNACSGTQVNYTGTLAYEDLWPYKGDYDFNDLVINYDFLVTKNLSEEIVHIKATFTIYAFGAGFYNGFGFTLPNVSPNQINNVTGYSLKNNSIIHLASNGLEAGQSKATVVVYDDSFDQMQHPGIGIGVNTDPSAPYVTPATLVVEMDFMDNGVVPAGGAISFSQLDIGNFNPFIIVNQNRDVEVHLPDEAPSSLANAGMLSTGDDDSDPSSNRYYLTETNLPWAINLPVVFEYPIEKQDITQVYNHFAEWAESSGTLYPDWYLDLPGYRNSWLIYTHN